MGFEKLKEHPNYIPKPALVDLLDLDQAAHLCGVSRLELSSLYHNGRLPENLFEKIRDEKSSGVRWKVRRSDIDELKEAIVKARSGTVKTIQTSDRLSLKEVAEKLGVKEEKLKSIRSNHTWPQGYEGVMRKTAGVKGPGTMYYPAEIVDVFRQRFSAYAKQEDKVDIKQGQWLTFSEISAAFGQKVSAAALYQRYAKGISWPKCSERQRGTGMEMKTREFHPSILRMLASIYKMPVKFIATLPQDQDDLPVPVRHEKAKVVDVVEDTVTPVAEPQPKPQPEVITHNGKVVVAVEPKQYITWVDVALYLAQRNFDTAAADILRTKVADDMQSGSAQK